MADVVVSFIETMRKGNVHLDAGRMDGTQYAKKLPTAYRQHRWDIPAFDFGAMLAGRGSEALSAAMMAQLADQTRERALKGGLHLPFPECFFILKYPETLHQWETINLVHLVEEDDGIVGTVYFLQEKAPRPQNVWTRAFYQFISTTSYTMTAIAEDAIVGAREAEDARLDAQCKDLELRAGLAMLLSPVSSNDVVETPELKEANKGRSNAKLPPLQPTRRIRFDRSAYSALKLPQSPETRSTRQPHDRRGHWRHLKKSNRDVWVRHSQIHGGSTIAPTYEIVS